VHSVLWGISKEHKKRKMFFIGIARKGLSAYIGNETNNTNNQKLFSENSAP
jgi:hypothetical protein